MVTITQDPSNPDRLILTQTATLFIEKLALQTLSDEVSKAIREQAVKDLQYNPAVKMEIAAASTRMLLGLLGVKQAEPDPIPAYPEVTYKESL